MSKDNGLRKRAIFANVAVFCVGVLMCLMLLIFDRTKERISSMLCLFAGIQGAVAVVSVCLCVRRDKAWQFDELGIVERRVIGKGKLIPYADMQAVVVVPAVDRYFSPFRDEMGNPKSVIVIYDNLDFARGYFQNNARFILPATSLENALSYSFFTEEVFRNLIERINETGRQVEVLCLDGNQKRG